MAVIGDCIRILQEAAAVDWQAYITHCFIFCLEQLRKAMKIPPPIHPQDKSQPLVPKMCDPRYLRPVPGGFVDTVL